MQQNLHDGKLTPSTTTTFVHGLWLKG